MRRAHAAHAGLLGLGLCACNALLGTEEPILDPPDGGAAAATTTTSAASGGGEGSATTSVTTGPGGGATSSTSATTSGTGGAGGAGGGDCDVTKSPEWAHWAPSDASVYTTTSDTAADAKTGLMWQRTLSNMPYTFDGATSYCDGLALDGHDDWRVPTRIELTSITDYTKTNPALDAVTFPGAPLYFWSSTGFPLDGTQAYSAYSGTGVIVPQSKQSQNAVRCVRP